MGERTGERVLRIGVIQGGKILDERLLRRRLPVTVGTDARVTFSIGASNLPRSFKLLDVVVDRYVLCFDDEMRGRLTLEGETLDLEGLKAKGLALLTGSSYRVELSENARGKVSIGDLTFLFQFVVPPPERERTQLPLKARGGWSTALDLPLALCLGASLLVHGAALSGLRAVERPAERSLFELSPRWTRFVLPRQLPANQPIAPIAGTAAVPGSAPAAVPASLPTGGAFDGELRPGILRIIGATGPAAGPSTTVDLLAAGGRSGDLDELLQHMAGVAVASPAPASRPTSAPASAPAAGTQPARGEAFLRGATAASQMAGSVLAEAPEVIEGSLDPAVAAGAVRPRFGAVRWCYSEALARNPQLQGRIVIGIAIDAAGQVIGSRIDSNTLGDDAAGRCIETVIKRASFPAPGPGGAQLLFSYACAP